MMLFKILKTKVLRQRAFVTLLVLAAFQILAALPLPGLPHKAFSSPMFSLLNLTSGGGYTNLSLMALGVSPYITASIIVQMLSNGLVKRLTRYSQEGHVGVKKLNKLTKQLTILFALLQAPTLVFAFKQFGAFTDAVHLTWETYFVATCLVVAGAMVAMFMGDTLNKYGLGNGPSLLIAGNIMAQFPHTIKTIAQAFNSQTMTQQGLLASATFIFGLLLIVWMNGVEKRLPLQHLRETTRTSKAGYLPIKLNPSGMVPVIFAGGVLSIATMASQFNTPFTKALKVLDLTNPIGLAVYAALTLLFGVTYSLIQMSPKKVTRHLQQSSTYIVGIELDATEAYLSRQIMHIGGVGAIFLTLIAILPYLTKVQGYISLISLLIVVGSLLEVTKQIGGISEKYTYETTL